MTERPPRPVLVELGSAILIVGSLTAVLGLLAQWLVVPSLPADAGFGVPLFAALNVAMFGIGLLIRSGRWWRLCLNAVGIAIVLYLTRMPNPVAFLYVLLDAIVVFALLRYRAWFDWVPATAPSVEDHATEPTP